MNIIAEQIREQAHDFRWTDDIDVRCSLENAEIMEKAADTIEQLAAKVRDMPESEKTALSYKEGWNDGFNCGMETGEKACKRAFEDIRAEIDKRTINQGFPEDEWCMSYNDIMKIIDRNDPSKAGKPTYYHDTEHDADIEWGEEIDALVKGDIECGEDAEPVGNADKLENKHNGLRGLRIKHISGKEQNG